MTDTLFRRIYAVLGIGLFLEFFGHGVWGIKGSPKFIDLVTGTADSVGISVGNSTGLTLVHIVGYADVVLASVFAVVIINFFTTRPTVATSKLAIGLLAWASIWGFLTAASRPLAGGWGDIWDLVERGPNFMLPLALVLLTLAARQAYVPAEAVKKVFGARPTTA